MSAGAVLDHLVVGAADLSSGRAWAERLLGAPPAGGGVHAAMSTHNALWRLGDAYLEVIAIDPAAPDPGRPRWFGLDGAEVQARLAERPRLLTWVVRPARPLDEVAADVPAVGTILALSRGDLHWRLTVPDDGAMPFHGRLPTLIEWAPGAVPPPERLVEAGLSLAALTVGGATPDLAAALVRIGAGSLARLDADGPPRLTASIGTPAGRVTLD